MIFLIITALAILVPTISLGSESALDAAFKLELEELSSRYGFPGATAAYVLPNGSSRAFATGWADVERKLPMSIHSHIPSASIGKTYLGALAVSLAEEGVIDLDAPVAPVLKQHSWFVRLPNHEQISLRHLLNHSSGLRDHVYTESFAADVARRWSERDNPFTPERLAGYILDLPPLFAPGTSWAYSDTGYILAGIVLEEVTARSCQQDIVRRFLGPLGLEETSAADRRELPGLATGYMADDNRFGLPPRTTDANGAMNWHPAIEGMGGGWVCTARDLARWGHALFVGEAISDKARQGMLQAVPVQAGRDEVLYGIGVAVRRKGAHGTSLGHGGWIPGYCSSLRHYAKHDVTIAFQINTDMGIVDHESDAADILEERLAAIVIEHLKVGGNE